MDEAVPAIAQSAYFFVALGFGCLNVLGTFSLVQIPTFDAFRSPCEGDLSGSSFFRFW